MKRVLLSLSGLAALSGAGFGQNLVVNGDFSLRVPNSGTLNGWTAARNDGSGGWRSTGGNPGGTYILNDNGNTTNNPIISQDITLVIGQSYRVTGDYAAGNVGNGVDLDFGVSIDGNLWEFDVPAGTTNWASLSQIFVATSVLATLELSGERHSDRDPRVDNIVVEAVVPEPASIIAMALGALLFVRRRR